MVTMIFAHVLMVSMADTNPAMAPRFLDAQHVLLEARSKLQFASYNLHIWPARLPYSKLRELLRNLDGCTVFQIEQQQTSCIGADYIVSTYASDSRVLWSEAYIEEQVREETASSLTPVSVYQATDHSIHTWVTRDSIRSIYRQALDDAQASNWQIVLHDIYAGSFVLAKENKTESVSIAGWQQDDGRVFITRLSKMIDR